MAKIDLDLDEQLQILQQELDDAQDFYEQVKTHYDRIMQSKSTGTFKFITDQTSNIMNIRNGKVNIIKEMINIKKLKAEMQIKELSINKNENGDNGYILEISRSVYDMMKADKREGNVSALLEKANKKDQNAENNKKENSSKNEEMLKERMLKIREKKQAQQKEKEIKERGYIFACDTSGKVYAVNLEGTEIYDDVEIPDFEVTFETDDLTGLTVAKNQYGDTMEIIEIS